ncbi:MAG TPA: hypothetical protein PKL84_15610, partial [Candidatus Hydrogenedentes bacterium]|nr:hypothetical protein [Candidatus Hydrogenedentota bacterium]
MCYFFIIFGLAAGIVASTASADSIVPLMGAHIVTRGPDASPAEQMAARILVEETAKRWRGAATNVPGPWQLAEAWPEALEPIIALVSGDIDTLQGMPLPNTQRPNKPESYVIHTDASRPVVWLIGADGRGVLYAA